MFALLAAFVCATVVSVGWLVDLQALRPEKYVDLGQEQRIRTVNLAGYRGMITDRDGFVFALSTPGTEIVADPSMIDDPAATARLLAPVLNMSFEELAELLLPSSPEDRYTMIAATISDSTAALISVLQENNDNDAAFVGIFVRAQEDRVYPADNLAMPVVGRVDPQELGVSGLEWQYDEDMQGSSGYEQIEAGMFGSITGGEYIFEPATPGTDLVLTLDHRIQYVTEQALLEHCEETQASGANAVVSDPRTGEILAMATVTRRDGKCVVPRQNSSLVSLFEPGSVIKMVTAAAAAEDQGVLANTMIDVPSSITVGDKEFQNHSPAAPYPVRQIIGDSMNAGTIKLALGVGEDRLRYYLEAFGFGQSTGLSFPYEAPGSFPEEWFGSDIGSISIGQGINVNTVQLAAAYNVIANGGLYVSPSLVRSRIRPDGTLMPSDPQRSHRVVSAETAHEVTLMLSDVVSSGTGTAAAIPDYNVAGKTGTAWQVFQQADGSYGYGTDADHRYVVTFAGFLPAEDPQLSIVVVVNEPETASSASKIAAPVFADIAQYAIRILAIPPSDTTTDGLVLTGLVRGTAASAPGSAADEAQSSSEAPNDPIGETADTDLPAQTEELAVKEDELEEQIAALADPTAEGDDTAE